MTEVHNFNKRVILFEVVYAWVCLFVKLEFFEEEFYYYFFILLLTSPRINYLAGSVLMLRGTKPCSVQKREVFDG
jgi:hypothetical protein